MTDFTLDDGYVTLLLNRLGRRNDTTLQDSVVDELNQAQKQLERGRFLPWFLLQQMTDDTISADQQLWLPSYADYFLRECDESPLILEDSDGIKIALTKGDHTALTKKYLNVDSGIPKYYSLIGRTFHIWPAPNKTYYPRLWCYVGQRDIALFGIAATNRWLVNASDWLLSTAGEQLAALHVQNPDMAARFARAAAVARDNIMTLHEARIHTNMNYTDDSEFERGN